MFPTKIKSGEARAKWRDILDQVFAGKDMLIERNGKEIAVMIPAVDYKEIRETLEDLRLAREAEKAYQEWKEDPSVMLDWKEVEAELALKE